MNQFTWQLKTTQCFHNEKNTKNDVRSKAYVENINKLCSIFARVTGEGRGWGWLGVGEWGGGGGWGDKESDLMWFYTMLKFLWH